MAWAGRLRESWGGEFHDDVTGADGTIAFVTLEGRQKLGLHERANLAKDASLPLGHPSSTEFSLGIPATSREDPTDWTQVVALYDHLLCIDPSPVVALNRAVAVAEAHGAAAALASVDGLDLDHYHLFHAVRAELLRRLARPVEAPSAYDRAIELTGNSVERAHLERQRRETT